MPWVKRRKKWNKRDIKIYVAATVFCAVTAVALNLFIDWGSNVLEGLDTIAEISTDAEPAEKVKFIEKNVDAEFLEHAKKACEKNNRVDAQKIKEVSGNEFDARELEILKKTYKDLKSRGYDSKHPLISY